MHLLDGAMSYSLQNWHALVGIGAEASALHDVQSTAYPRCRYMDTIAGFMDKSWCMLAHVGQQSYPLTLAVNTGLPSTRSLLPHAMEMH